MGKTCLPNKAIRPYITQAAMYLAVCAGAFYLAYTGGARQDWVLAFVLLILAVVYTVMKGIQVFSSRYAVQGDALIVRSRGFERILLPEDIAMAYYDSNSKNLELHARDGNIMMLVDYDNLYPMTDYLDDHGIRIEYKRITLK